MDVTPHEEPTRAKDRPELLPFLPLLLSIWNDGILSAAELAALFAGVDAHQGLSDTGRAALKSWMDPESPPTATELAEVRGRIRAATLSHVADATRSLSDLGLAVWASAGGGGPWKDPEAIEALRALEASLGVLGAEAARGILGVSSPDLQETPVARRGVDSGKLRDLLDGDVRGLRDQVLELLTRPELTIAPGLPLPEYRERVLVAVQFLADRGLGRLAYPKEYGGAADPVASIAVFETLAFGDLSVLIKFGVQFGLFGGSVHQLGTARHHAEYLERIGSLELPGCYAMTETLHGSNVRDLETTATYDHGARELVVHSPTSGAAKDYIGNAALHGELATVFCRLLVEGEDHGVHAVLVPIRGRNGTVCDGVRITDRNLKAGLNGVDNGRIVFDHVRVPVDNLLDRFGSIDRAGHYYSPIPSAGRRFFGMLRTLVAGRISIAAASVSATKLGLVIAVRYAARRRQFGAQGEPETRILDYPLIQRALAPRLATTFGLHFAVRALEKRFGTPSADDAIELEVQAAGLKAYASTHCAETLQACREACGGQGYIAENRLAALKADTDIFTTFEGANPILYQLVAKGLLSRFREEMGELNLWRALQYLGERAETSLTELNPVITRRTDAEHLLDPEFHLAALSYREERLLRSAAMRMRARLRDGVDSFQAVLEVQDHLVTLSRAHVERLILERFQVACSAAESTEVSESLSTVCSLFALSRIEADRGWFLECGYIEGNKSRAIRAQVNVLCRDVSDLGEDLVAGFGIPEALLPELMQRPLE